jgi:diadenylate cyclase
LTTFDLIPPPTWRDLVDILFLTIVAYQLYVWFRRTRALRVLIGLVVLGGVYSVARLWGLFLTTWVFQILWQVLLILLLILFQSEIRQVLEKVSPLRYLRFKRRMSTGVFVKQLAETVFDLARGGMGAIIVLARDDDLSEFLSAGQKIMALPEPALIKSIFNHHGPAHDGAVILSEGRLTHMCCILPLSEREDIPEQYGTRHRAALGLSERSDAVCLVVSEERGEVSTVIDGKIAVCENPGALTERVRGWLRPEHIPGPTLRGFFKGVFVENWGAKLGALTLVTAAWLVLASQQEMNTTVTVPVRYFDVPAELVLDKGSDRTVNLTLSGRRQNIRTLEAQEVRIQVGLAGRSAGAHLIKLSARNVEVPLGLTVERVTPQDIRVILKAFSGGKKTPH